MGERVVYKRVSSLDQNVERQCAGMTFDKEFIEKASAAQQKKRPVLEEFITYLRKGDEAFVHSLDRLGRSAGDLEKTIEKIIAKGASIHIVSENLTFDSNKKSSPAQELMFYMIASFAKFERSIIRERQAEGIAVAKKKGVYEGRKAIHNYAERERIVMEANQADMFGPKPKKIDICKKYKISRKTLYRYENEFRKK